MNINVLAKEQEKQGGAIYQSSFLDIGKSTQEAEKAVSSAADVVSVRLGEDSAGDNTAGYLMEECAENQTMLTEAKEEKTESLAVLNGENYGEIEEEEGSLEEKTQEHIERAAKRARENDEWKEERIAENKELREELEEGLKRQQAMGFLSQKSEAQIRNAMQEAGIPVTEGNLNQVVTALGMGYAALDMTDSSKSYMIGQSLTPTIDHLYQSKYAVSAEYAKLPADTQEFENYRSQVADILEDCGRTTEEDFQKAQWLFENELPVNAQTLQELDTLNEIATNLTPDKLLGRILYTVNMGAAARDTLLDDRGIAAAEQIIDGFNSITDGAILQVSQSAMEAQNQSVGTDAQEKTEISLAVLLEAQEEVNQASGDGQTEKTIALQYVEDMTEQELMQVTVKRRLEEIRQKMTVQSAVAMEQKGIHVETESLENVINALREIENAYYVSQAEDGQAPTADELDLLQETLQKTEDIAVSHAALLGSGVRRQTLLTMNTLHAAISSQAANQREWNGIYETVSTQARTDLGDSMQKAFANVPQLLEELGLEDTQANERAVRILGYNEMEITKDAVTQVKYFDEQVNSIIDNMKPSVVLEMIREGQNPLDTPLEQLNEKLEEIRDKNGVGEQERYSRFLWQAQKNNEMTQEERESYIGIYRLLHQIEESDGAVIGAVMETGQEMTLGNLLTQSRIRKGKGINAAVDQTTGLNEGSGAANSITDQIAKGFYQSIAKGALSDVTPSKLQEMTEDGKEDLLSYSLEKFCEEIKNTDGDTELADEYYEEQAQEIRTLAASDSQAQEYLANLQIPATVGNLLAVQAVLKENYSVYRESSKRKHVLEKEQEEEFDSFLDMAQDLGETQEELNAKCEKAEKIMGDILTKSYEQADINIEDLQDLKMLDRGIRLEGALWRSQSYDIPIRTGDTVTALNLTLIHGSEESGKIQISMEDAAFGNVAMEFKVTDGQGKGLVLCDRRQGFEALQAGEDTLRQALSDVGCQVKHISYGMDFRERNELLNEPLQNQETETAQLYRIAKVLVGAVAQAVQNQEA